MAEKDPNLEWNLEVSDLSSVSLDDESLNDIDEILDSGTTSETTDTNVAGAENLNLESGDQSSTPIDERVFLDSWEGAMSVKNVIKDGDNFWSYLRRFFFSALVTLLWVLAIALFYSFSMYIREASKPKLDDNYVSYVQKYKEKYKSVKEFFWIKNSYTAPTIVNDDISSVNKIINADDIDYIEKKDLLSKYASDIVSNTENRAATAEQLKEDVAKQSFLPEELWILLSEDQAIDTIQRSLNALEVIKFSTATKVFSYMNTALSTISEMVRIWWADVESIRDLFVQLGSRWEKDISSYVYMCYLNPFETNVNCDNIWDLDMYYDITNDDSIDIRLFKNTMSAISQLLEKEDTSLFSITFNWFNAEDQSILFNIEVYTNQEDERALMAQRIRNPNIFILTNIINLLKQSSFIIWAEIFTKEIHVDVKTIEQWWIMRNVNYSTMDFEVPIQRDTQREIFDYIDLDSMERLISERGFGSGNEALLDEGEVGSEDIFLDEEDLDILDDENYELNQIDEESESLDM